MKTIINRLFDLVHVEESKLLPAKKGMNWIPVIARGEFYMGVNEDGEWVVEVSEGLHCLYSQKLFVYVMVLLEQPIDEIRGKIATFFKKIEIEIDVNEVFPFVEIIRAGFEQGADYWAKLAFKWYDELPNDKKEQLKDSVLNITKAKWASQKLRQRAKNELRRI